MEYHQTEDILHVMRMLDHTSIKNRLVYTQLVDLRNEDYVSKVAWILDKACRLEAGFEYVCQVEGPNPSESAIGSRGRGSSLAMVLEWS